MGMYIKKNGQLQPVAEVIKVSTVPTATLNIETNELHDVTNYKFADVNVPGYNIDTMPHVINRKWSFPAEWSIQNYDNNIELIPIAADEEVLYFLVDASKEESFIRLRLYNQCLADYGYCNQGVYTAISATTTVNSGQYIGYWFGDLNYSTVVVRIRPNTGQHLTMCQTYAWASDGTHTTPLAASANTILMRYGRMPYGVNIVISNCFTIESDNVIDFAASLSNTNLTMANLYSTCVNLKRWRHTGWNIAGNYVASYSQSFYGLYSLIDIDNYDFSGWVKSNTTNLYNIFYANRFINEPINVSNWDLTNVTTVANLFSECHNVMNIIGTDTWIGGSKITTWQNVFGNCRKITGPIDLRGLTLGSTVITYNGTFTNCYSLQEIYLPNIDFTNVTTTANMFNCCYSLKTLVNGTITPATTKLTVCSGMFNYCYLLTSINMLRNWNISNCTASLSSVFSNMNCLQSSNNIDLTGVALPSTSYSYNSSWSPYYNCFNMTYIDMSMFDASKDSSSAKYMTVSMISNCYNVIDFYPCTNLQGKAFSLAAYQKLSHDSLVRILNNLVDLTGKTSVKLTLGTGLLAKLSDAEKAIATNKNWTLG